MSKKVFFEDKGRKATKVGMDILANQVRITMGPKGRNVAIKTKNRGLVFTNDGDTIARETVLADEFQETGADVLREASYKTNEAAGDGTTTTTVLTHAIISSGMKHKKKWWQFWKKDMSGVLIRRGIEAAASDVMDVLKKISKPIETNEEIAQIATISVEDENIGQIIADTIQGVGKDGVVTVEESNTFGIESEIVEGMEIDKGYISHYMITNPDRMEAEIRKAAILITDYSISSGNDMSDIMLAAKSAGHTDLVIIAEDVSGDALALAIINKARGVFNCVAVRAPGFGDGKKGILEDIAIKTGATFISRELKGNIKEASNYGFVDTFIAGKDKSTIVVDNPTAERKAQIEDRVKYLRNILESTDAQFEVERLQNRIARLSGGVGVIRVGAASEYEMKYWKLKIEDAVNATKAAIAEGIVPGGGVALIVAKMNLTRDISKEEREFQVGYKIVLEAIEAPIRQIVRNASKDDKVVLKNILEKKSATWGYDARNDRFLDMIEAGIIDPVKVTRTALEQAASTAGIYLTAGAFNVEMN